MCRVRVWFGTRSAEFIGAASEQWVSCELVVCWHFEFSLRCKHEYEGPDLSKNNQQLIRSRLSLMFLIFYYSEATC